MMEHATIYDAAALYDLAFSYRDFPKETRFLRQLYAQRLGREPRSFLELAAGPARHALEMRAEGLDVAALDLSAAMAAHSQHRARERGLPFQYVVGDMTNFAFDRNFDLIACMLCSATYLLTDEQFQRHLSCVRAALADDGVYILELPHPDEASEAKTSERWTMKDERGELSVEWCEAAAENKLLTIDVRLEYRPRDGRPPQLVVDRGRQRDISEADLSQMARATGFVVSDVFGALDEAVALHDPKAWRMVAVLRKA
ncbi:MAG: class I SAM-dependent methyltransferase [Deltaproteobacteria bacterium]